MAAEQSKLPMKRTTRRSQARPENLPRKMTQIAQKGHYLSHRTGYKVGARQRRSVFPFLPYPHIRPHSYPLIRPCPLR